jgi:hypothetical protein
MTALEAVKKQWHWAGLALLSALIAAGAFVAPDRISEIELEREARLAATRLQAQVLKEPDVLIDALSGPALTPQFAALLDKSGYGHRVLRYEFYDQDGGLAFTSGLAGLSLNDEIAQPPTAFSNGTPRVSLYEASSGSAPSHFAALALPLSLHSGARGTLVIYLDQSDQASALSN